MQVDVHDTEGIWAHLSGRRTIPAGHFEYPPTIEAGDLLLVDFDRRNLTEEDLFLLSLPRPGYRWIGCRRFRCKLDGSIWVADTDNGAWQPYQAHVGFKVIGKVLTVYKEARCG